MEVNANEIYTPKETKIILKISQSTLRRLIKKGIIQASKIGGQYRILGKNLLHIMSPALEKGVGRIYKKSKDIGKKIIKEIDDKEKNSNKKEKPGL